MIYSVLVFLLLFICTALGETNETFYRNIYTGQQLPMQQRQPLRPHRRAPEIQSNRPKNPTTSIPQPSL